MTVRMTGQVENRALGIFVLMPPVVRAMIKFVLDGAKFVPIRCAKIQPL